MNFLNKYLPRTEIDGSQCAKDTHTRNGCTKDYQRDDSCCEDTRPVWCSCCAGFVNGVNVLMQKGVSTLDKLQTWRKSIDHVSFL